MNEDWHYFVSSGRNNRITWIGEFLRDLPETPFWEGDFVRLRDHSPIIIPFDHDTDVLETDILQIIGIDFDCLTKLTLIGTKYPAYKVSNKFDAGWHTSVREDDMILVERGPVWKFFHDEPITFADIKDEAKFFELLGHTVEIRNPANGLCEWTIDEVLDAIRKGLVHGFSVSWGFFGSGSFITAKRFRNEELGKRVAKAILEGFNMASS